MTFADLSAAEQAALRWLIRATLVYGHGHHDTTPALVRLWGRDLADVDFRAGTWAANDAARAIWAHRRPRLEAA